MHREDFTLCNHKLSLFQAEKADCPLFSWATERIHGKASFIGIAGYSLAGLFALYALYKTDVFTRVASMSGSLWFPGIKEFCKENAIKILPEKLYLSIGEKESKTRHPILKTMQENTEDLLKHFKSMGIETTYEVNPGNHFQDVNLRCAKGILELLR